MNAEVLKVAQALLQSRRNGQVIASEPYLQSLNGADDAYAAQALVAAQLKWHSAPVAKYWKSGGANREAIITHAGLPPEGVRHSPANLTDLTLHLHGIEAEIAIRLGCDVNVEMLSTASEADARGWIADMTVATEIISNHWDMGYDTPAWLKLADLQSHGALVLGDWQPWRALDWASQTCQILVNGQVVQRCKGSHPLGSPDWGLRVFAKHIIGEHRVLPAGTVITTGSWNGIYRAQAGDQVEVNFDGLGSVELRM
jgi:2-keto-4-pentenoate hydratase